MNLYVAQLKNKIRKLLETEGIDGSVTDKVNAHRELIAAVILQERCPACNGRGRRDYVKDEPTPTTEGGSE